MAWGTPVTKGVVFNVTNSASCAIASVALTSGRLYLGFSMHHRAGAAGTYSNGSITGTTGGWSLVVQSATWNGGLRKTAAFYYIATATETVTVTCNVDTNTNSCTCLALIEIPSGFDTSTPIAAFDEQVAAAALSVTSTLASAPTAGNLSISGGGLSDSTAGDISPRTNWTELNQAAGTGTASDSGFIETQYKTALDAEQSASASVASTNRDWGWIHLELKAAASVARKAGRLSLMGCGHGAPR